MEQEVAAPPKGIKAKKKIVPAIVISIVIIIGLAIALPKIWKAIKYEETDNAQIEMRLTPILPRVSGYVDKIFVDDYASVKKGQLIMTIDSTELVLQLSEMEADYNQAEADLSNAKASLENASAGVALSKSNSEVVDRRKDQAISDFNRDKELYEAGAITKKQFDDSKSQSEIAQRQFVASEKEVKASETKIGILRSTLERATAQIKLKKSRIEQQKLKISYCKIYATSDGNVGKRNVDAGQYVQAGSPIFTIVNNQDLWIVANYKENQIKNIQVGKEVEISVDGYSNLDIKGKVAAISEATGARFSLLPPDNATGNFIKVTQRIPVKIEIENLEKYKDILRAGMSVEVSSPIN